MKDQELLDGYDDKWIHNMLTAYDSKFSDNEDTVVIIDEIQESATVYSLIRNFSRDFKAHFIVTGSYLGKTVDKEFFKSAGDVESLTLYPLSFEEFLMARGKAVSYSNIDLFGGSSKSDYEDLYREYLNYLQIGGYPEVVQLYLDGNGLTACLAKLRNIIDVFTIESCGYLEDPVDTNIFSIALKSIVSIMVTDSIGVTDLTKELYKSLNNQGIRINKGIATKVISWLYNSGVIGHCDRANECDKFNKTHNSRLYFNDVGICNYFLRDASVDVSTLIGLLSENFVYLALKKKIDMFELSGGMPCFGTYRGGETDFLAQGYFNGKLFGIEVKSGKNIGKTSNALLKDGKIDELYLLKGNTIGGVSGKISTVPIWLADRISFDNGLPILTF